MANIFEVTFEEQPFAHPARTGNSGQIFLTVEEVNYLESVARGCDYGEPWYGFKAALARKVLGYAQ